MLSNSLTACPKCKTKSSGGPCAVCDSIATGNVFSNRQLPGGWWSRKLNSIFNRCANYSCGKPTANTFCGKCQIFSIEETRKTLQKEYPENLYIDFSNNEKNHPHDLLPLIYKAPQKNIYFLYTKPFGKESVPHELTVLAHIILQMPLGTQIFLQHVCGERIELTLLLAQTAPELKAGELTIKVCNQNVDYSVYLSGFHEILKINTEICHLHNVKVEYVSEIKPFVIAPQNPEYPISEVIEFFEVCKNANLQKVLHGNFPNKNAIIKTGYYYGCNILNYILTDLAHRTAEVHNNMLKIISYLLANGASLPVINSLEGLKKLLFTLSNERLDPQHIVTHLMLHGITTAEKLDKFLQEMETKIPQLVAETKDWNLEYFLKEKSLSNYSEDSDHGIYIRYLLRCFSSLTSKLRGMQHIVPDALKHSERVSKLIEEFAGADIENDNFGDIMWMPVPKSSRTMSRW